MAQVQPIFSLNLFLDARCHILPGTNAMLGDRFETSLRHLSVQIVVNRGGSNKWIEFPGAGVPLLLPVLGQSMKSCTISHHKPSSLSK